MVTFGHLHHGNPKFEPAEQNKRKLTALFAYENQTTDEDLLNKIKKEIEYLRKCYNPEDTEDLIDEQISSNILTGRRRQRNGKEEKQDYPHLLERLRKNFLTGIVEESSSSVIGMLHNYFGSDEDVADLFRRMSRDLVPDSDSYSVVTENIHKYCNSWPWIIRIYSNYFSSNWSFLALLGAIAGLSLTLLQTHFAMNPKK
ncbi:hypothetical protein REPUB_Repub20aG0048000 [Reevesia pubescens]